MMADVGLGERARRRVQDKYSENCMIRKPVLSVWKKHAFGLANALRTSLKHNIKNPPFTAALSQREFLVRTS